jgi:hypothetical protein
MAGMREVIFFVASLAGAALLTALAVIVAPTSPFWQWVLWSSAGILVLCAIALFVDIIRRVSAKRNILQVSWKWLSCSFSSPSAEPATTALEAAVPSLLHRYEEDDRKRLSGAMFDLYELLNKRVSPAQLEVHKITSGFLYRVGNEGSQFIIDKLLELRDIFFRVRDELIDSFIPGNHYYADEIQDILSNKDPLNAELAAIDDYVSALGAILSEPQERLIKMMGPYQDKLREVNFSLGNWVGDCNVRIKAKRNELQ